MTAGTSQARPYAAPRAACETLTRETFRVSGRQRKVNGSNRPAANGASTKMGTDFSQTTPILEPRYSQEASPIDQTSVRNSSSGTLPTELLTRSNVQIIAPSKEGARIRYKSHT